MISFSQLADQELNKIFGIVEGEGLGGKDLANKCLRHFYREAIVYKYYLLSTGRWNEYSQWLKRFRKVFPTFEGMIENNLQLEEINCTEEKGDEENTIQQELEQ